MRQLRTGIRRLEFLKLAQLSPDLRSQFRFGRRRGIRLLCSLAVCRGGLLVVVLRGYVSRGGCLRPSLLVGHGGLRSAGAAQVLSVVDHKGSLEDGRVGIESALGSGGILLGARSFGRGIAGGCGGRALVDKVFRPSLLLGDGPIDRRFYSLEEPS